MSVRSYVRAFVYSLVVVVPITLLFLVCSWFYYSVLPSFSESFLGSGSSSSVISPLQGKKQKQQALPTTVTPPAVLPDDVSLSVFHSAEYRYSLSYPSTLVAGEDGMNVDFKDGDGNTVFSVISMTIPQEMVPLEASGTRGHLFDDYVERAGIDDMGYHSLRNNVSFATASGIPCHFTVWNVDAEGKSGSSIVYCYRDTSHVTQMFVFSQAYAKDFMNLVLSFRDEK